MIRKVVCPKRDLAIALTALLTFANSPNVGISTAKFLRVGDCVRALPRMICENININQAILRNAVLFNTSVSEIIFFLFTVLHT